MSGDRRLTSAGVECGQRSEAYLRVAPYALGVKKMLNLFLM